MNRKSRLDVPEWWNQVRCSGFDDKPPRAKNRASPASLEILTNVCMHMNASLGDDCGNRTTFAPIRIIISGPCAQIPIRCLRDSIFCVHGGETARVPLPSGGSLGPAGREAPATAEEISR